MIQAAVWDVGGVLVENPKFGKFWNNLESSKKLRRDFGTGKLSVNELVSKGSKLLNMGEKEFLDSYKRFYFNIKLMKEVFDVYKSINKDNYILSNTNPLHGNYIKEQFPEIFEIAKKTYLSYEIGMRKDGIGVFEYVIKDIGLNPEEILFIDDEERNIIFARRAGMKTICFVNVEKLKEELNKLKELK